MLENNTLSVLCNSLHFLGIIHLHRKQTVCDYTASLPITVIISLKAIISTVSTLVSLYPPCHTAKVTS